MTLKLQFHLIQFLLVIIFLVIISCDSSGISIKPIPQIIHQYETLFIKINVNKTYENPYDPENIRVDAIFTNPDGGNLILPCFYQSGVSGKSVWEVRFTASKIGRHTFYIQAISKNDSVKSKKYQFEVIQSNKNGFLRMNDRSYYSLVFDSGKRFRGVGLNICWENTPEWPYTYETYFDTMANNNANFTRIWMCPWNLPLEWTRVMHYQEFVDEFENWNKTFWHSPGLILASGKTRYTEDDLNRVIISGNTKEEIIYKLDNIKRFKIKLFYKDKLSQDGIKCYGSRDNIEYRPINIECSQNWYTNEIWQRIFLAYISDLPDGVNYLKIEFEPQIKGNLHLANVVIEYGEPKDVLNAPGLGSYYQKTAERLDEILRLAEEKGIYIMLALDYHGIFKPYIDVWASNAEWRMNPYNATNGGPCDTPADFFTNTIAKKYYKKRLRYMVARWGYSTNLAVWEFWNEIDNAMEWQKIPAESIVDWHREMSDYLKGIDPYKRIISSSVSSRKVPGLWELKNIDFSQHHNYGPTENMHSSIVEYEQAYNKPDVVGEYSLGWKGPGKDYPVELYEGEVHNGLWRGMFSPTPILPLTWWWEWHFSRQEFYHFKVANEFVSKILLKNKGVLEEVKMNSGNRDLEIWALKNDKDLFIWVLNISKILVEFNHLKIVNGQKNGTYLLTQYNTWSGVYSEGETVIIDDGQLKFNSIQLGVHKDLALYLKPVE